MDVIFNRSFQRVILYNLEKMHPEAKKGFFEITRNFPFEDIYILGGFVRDSILKFVYNYNFPINDLDILVDDPKFNSFSESFQKDNISRLGGLKFNYPSFSIDVFGMDNIFFFKDNSKLDKNLENVLIGCDISTSCFAYNLASKNIYSVGAMEDILKREININNHLYMEAAPTISRLILHADKMGFNIGESGVNYIKDNYSSEVDKKILEFLKYKNIERLFPLIKSNINKII